MAPIPRILVAGQNGQVARALQHQCDPSKFALTALSREKMDIASAASVQAAFEAHSPGIVINAAAYTAVDQAEHDEELAFAVNAVGAENLAKASAARGIPILHLSTDYVFNGSKTEPYVEDDPVSPLGVYGASKLAGERAVAAENPKHLILRTAWVYSPYGKNFVKTMLRLAETRNDINVVADQIGNPTSALDIAAGLLLIAEKISSAPENFRTGTYNMCGKSAASWATFAKGIFAVSSKLGGPVANIHSITSDEYPTPVKRPENSRLDCAKLEEDYGIGLGGWEASLGTCVKQLFELEGQTS